VFCTDEDHENVAANRGVVENVSAKSQMTGMSCLTVYCLLSVINCYKLNYIQGGPKNGATD